jgi:hypothetical protein
MVVKLGLRKLALTLHILTSIGWIGAIAGYLVLAIVGVESKDIQLVRSVYTLSNLIAWYTILPLAFASFLTGIICSLVTKWGLFRYRWVVAKLLLNLLAIVVLLLKMPKISFLANVAGKGALNNLDFLSIRLQLVGHATGGMIVLLVATILAVYKPKGLTRYGRRKLREESRTITTSE